MDALLKSRLRKNSGKLFRQMQSQTTNNELRIWINSLRKNMQITINPMVPIVIATPTLFHFRTRSMPLFLWEKVNVLMWTESYLFIDWLCCSTTCYDTHSYPVRWIKDNRGDHGDVSNYRGITIAYHLKNIWAFLGNHFLRPLFHVHEPIWVQTHKFYRRCIILSKAND